MPRALVAAVTVLPFAGSVVVALTWLYKPLFELVTAEDRLLEWLQVAAYVAAAALAAALALHLVRSGSRLLATAWALLAISCVLVAGEEISWGQRIFDYGTPESLEHVNRQREATVHNIDVVEDAFHVVLMLGGLYGWVSPLLFRVRKAPGPLADLLVPPLFLAPAFFLLFAFRLGRLTGALPERNGVVESGEWPELCLALALAVFAFLQVRARREVFPRAASLLVTREKGGTP